MEEFRNVEVGLYCPLKKKKSVTVVQKVHIYVVAF